MHLFVMANEIPYADHSQPGVTAINIIEFEMLRSLLDLGYQIDFQLLFNIYKKENFLSDVEQQQLNRLQDFGVSVLPPLFPEDFLPAQSDSNPWGKLRRLIFGDTLEDLYPAVRLQDLISKRIDQSQADLIFTLHCPEGVAATHGYDKLSKVAYHGDPDTLTGRLRLQDRDLFFEKPDTFTKKVLQQIRFIRGNIFHKHAEQAHLDLMMGVDIIANLSASNVGYYTNHGHPRSVYIPNIWSAQTKDEIPQVAHSGQPDCPMKIIGHMGYLGMTGSTYGLRYLLQELMPALENALEGIAYEVHIIGGGEVVPGLRSLLNQERLVIHGYVEDLDAELESSDVFLMLNNAGPYSAAFTRHMLAWSQGLCLIAHSNSLQAIPEIKHEENTLLGSTPDEIATQVRRAVTDRTLNMQVREGGRATYFEHFTAQVVVGKLSQYLKEMVKT